MKHGTKTIEPGIAAGWLRSDVALMLWRLLMVYVALGMCRVAFYLYNRELVGAISPEEWWPLLRGALTFDTVSVLYANALFIVLSLIPLRLRAKRWWRGVTLGYYMVANTCGVLAVNLSDATYFRYTLKRFTSEEVFFAGNDNTPRIVLEFMAENWYLVLLFLFLAWGLWVAYRRKVVPATPIRNYLSYYAFGVIVFALAVGLTVGGIRGGFSRSTRPLTLSNATQYTSSSAKANLILSNPFCIVRTMGGGRIYYTRYFDEAHLDGIFTPDHYPAADSLAGAQGRSDNHGSRGSLAETEVRSQAWGSLAGRNVVIFIMESFSAEHSALLSPELYGPGEEGFTPFLDELMRDGFTFTDAHANGHKSIEALPSVLGSMPSFRQPFVLLPQSLGVSRQMPAILDGEGYATSFFCGSPRGSMGFEAYARSAGIGKFYGQQDYESARGGSDFDGYWGIWDEPFLDYMGGVLSEGSEPFLSIAFTLSSHHPFVVPREYGHLPAGKTKIHKGVRYTDTAIRHFFEKYAGQEWFDNTVFVFVADHVSSETFAPVTRTILGGTHIVQFLYTPDGSLRGEHTLPAQQTDLMPTLLGLLGYDAPYFGFGRDVLNEPSRRAVSYGFSTSTFNFHIADENYLLLFDESEVTAAYRRDDLLMEHPLPAPYPPAAESLTEYLEAVIQQYYSHLEAMDYTVPTTVD